VTAVGYIRSTICVWTILRPTEYWW